MPDEIPPGFQTFADAFEKYAEVFKGVKLKPGETPDAQTIAKLAAAAKAFDSQDVKDAEQQISKWAENNCSSVGG